VKQSLEALAWLQAQHVQQLYFELLLRPLTAGTAAMLAADIGPVYRGADGRTETARSPSPPPAFPDNQRTVFKGHLFVGDVLLSDSGMKNHPLTPMRRRQFGDGDAIAVPTQSGFDRL
jgi:uncharacterized protein YgbK (DUF1537 family)